MNFSVSSKYLLTKLSIVGSALKTNTSLPILENFLFEIANDSIAITASDLNTTIKSKIKINSSEKETFNIAIPARFLMDTLKTFADIPLSFFINKETFVVTISSDYGKYEIQGEEADNFPKTQIIENGTNVTLETSLFTKAVNTALIAVSQDEMRQIMTGVLLDFEGANLHLVSSDGSKLIKYTINYKANEENNTQLIIPAKCLGIAKNVLLQSDLANFVIEFNKAGICFLLEETAIVCRLIDGKYPNYNAVIPKDNTNNLIVDKDAILSSLRRVAMFANKSTFLVTFHIKGSQLKLVSKDIDFMNAAEESLTVEYKGEDLNIGFNSKFLYEIVNTITTKEVSFSLSTPTTGALIFPEDESKKDITMLLMPLGN